MSIPQAITTRRRAGLHAQDRCRHRCRDSEQTLADRNRLSQWIDQHKKELPDEPTAKQVAFARSISERRRNPRF